MILPVIGALPLPNRLKPAKLKASESTMVPPISPTSGIHEHYAPVSYLRSVFTEAINHPDIRILSIATRPDCLNDDVLALLAELNKKKPVWVELGLQTIHEETAQFIRRGYKLPVFEDALRKLRKIGITVIVHTILCLPGESRE